VPNNRTNISTTVVWTTLEERRFSAATTAISQNPVISTEARSVSDGEWRNLLFRQRHHREGHDFSS
jgi:hypothetical protein